MGPKSRLLPILFEALPASVADVLRLIVEEKGDRERAGAVYSNVALGGPLNAQDVADCILFAVTRRPNVNIDEIVLMALAQVSGGNILRES